MAHEAFKVGELARRTRLTVRTLHHYDDIGLLRPSLHSGSGHRLYTAADIARLQQVLSLRSLGLSLDEVRACLDGPDFSPRRVLEMHLARLRQEIDQSHRLCRVLEALALRLGAAEEVSAEEFLQAIEEMSMYEKYYTPEQRKQLEERRGQVGEERIKQVQEEWPRLHAEVQAEMDRGTDPTSPRVQELARRWMALVREFTGGDPGLAKSVKAMWEQEPVIHGMETAPVRAMMEYINKALAAQQP
jgi:DNA-binding transcriptional MerR regulator